MGSATCLMPVFLCRAFRMTLSDSYPEAVLTQLKFADEIVLKVADAHGYVSGTLGLGPQVRLERLAKGVAEPPAVHACCFRVYQRFQYDERAALEARLQLHNLPDEFQDLLLSDLSVPLQCAPHTAIGVRAESQRKSASLRCPHSCMRPHTRQSLAVHPLAQAAVLQIVA